MGTSFKESALGYRLED